MYAMLVDLDDFLRLIAILGHRLLDLLGRDACTIILYRGAIALQIDLVRKNPRHTAQAALYRALAERSGHPQATQHNLFGEDCAGWSKGSWSVGLLWPGTPGAIHQDTGNQKQNQHTHCNDKFTFVHLRSSFRTDTIHSFRVRLLLNGLEHVEADI
jgi:hypothetical protein